MFSRCFLEFVVSVSFPGFLKIYMRIADEKLVWPKAFNTAAVFSFVDVFIAFRVIPFLLLKRPFSIMALFTAAKKKSFR